eukprot:CAMPEP_0117065636 /NCGR_PEP_ID=MMETSP0472-20121206/45897_1 /TAXON_ID=693140 ORGANISM="Tiarina fusus, Strain LIS" /NCGR_SAMPLE_ID=MMETSP0472 /ASSEMBLY_ACC=CAM_ASM_000603 /LENGTH=61 /DNA_ID=CAMNT_0004786365 /DNA_START=789 /DNA_END=974 /DNA_ORIENTATION=+
MIVTNSEYANKEFAIVIRGLKDKIVPIFPVPRAVQEEDGVSKEYVCVRMDLKEKIVPNKYV